mmetsp:Transcript_21990/g.32479  ORF Transcript_21990/g.32479 Transcript_21990/m.32479 type:complete len:457 (-) Transcript_21990:131-1501(-)|eukprot:CAMPEP_0194218648 /NCGR_PEP_ID=MMETSP0156-20130528/24264_1 /TAXON_ID=33649 /ORGANISM="Thalassionema nitzschioides, Strain L26-B" /LENGTH=456 /DNA_ID=CAMNT_0038948085 /DNA_START=65 /DNA_END=1438 /DNA_ORIENTATION=-
MVKARVATRIKEAVNGKKSTNRSIDLVALTQRYNVMKKKINRLATALHKHHSLIKEMSNSRLNVAAQITDLTEGSPLHSCGGSLEDNSKSYSTIHQNLSKKINGYSDKYQQFVVEYVMEWDKVISTRINSGLRTTDTLRRDLDHYQRKVEELHIQVNKSLAKGKMVEDKTKEKLKRNEEKYAKAKESYNKAARDMCMLLEETVDRGWKDLHPILVKMAQFDMTLAGEESKSLAEMDAVVTALKALASNNDIKAAGRLKEISSQEVSVLCTGTNDVPSIGNGEEASTQWGQASVYGESGYSLPPGSVAPQGMGGFPVQVQEEEIGPRQTPIPMASATLVSQISSTPMSTSDMLNVASNSAPAPTLEQIDSVADRGSSQLVLSNNPFDSDADAPIAPAPFAPPPPPPADSPANVNLIASISRGTAQGFSQPNRSRSTNPFDPPTGGTGRDPPTNPFAL